MNALRGSQWSSFLLMGADQSTLDKITSELNNQTTQVSLPHNCEEILKHADSPVDKSSYEKLLEKLYAGVFLNKGKKKYWAERGSKLNCFFLYARDLSITWGGDRRYWQWTSLKERNETLTVAELLNVCWLECHGKFEIANLSPDTEYEVVFVLKLKDPAYGWEVPVNVKLTLPDGSKQERKENLMQKPKGKWIEIKAGEFETASGNHSGEIQYCLYETKGGHWKKGLILKGVTIRPKA